MCAGCHHLLSAQEPLLSINFCLSGPLVSTDPAHQYFNASSLLQDLHALILFSPQPVLPTSMPCPPPASQTP